MRQQGRSAKHETAISNSLRMADEAAERGDYHDAFSWLEMVRVIDDSLPEAYERKRLAWSNKLAPPHALPD